MITSAQLQNAFASVYFCPSFIERGRESWGGCKQRRGRENEKRIDSKWVGEGDQKEKLIH